MEERSDHPVLPPGSLPRAVMGVVETLASAGHAAYLVGGCVRDLLDDRPVADFDVASSAPPECVLALLPRAIPIGLRHGTVMVPTAAGPVDVTTFRGDGGIAGDLAHRDFTLNAVAAEPTSGAILDPFGGLRDLAARRLRAVGSATARFAEDPLRILRAARLAATLGLAVDPEVAEAMSALRERVAAVAPERVRAELALLLGAVDPTPGLALLRRTGVEAILLPGARDDAAAVVAALPPDLDLRLAGWLRGTAAEGILRRLRFPRRTVLHVAHLLRQHPIEAGINPKRDVAVRKLIKRAHPEDLPALFRLREAELTCAPEAPAEAGERVASLRAAVARAQHAGTLALRRFDLAIDGEEVMETLGCGPGRRVGQALRHLTDRVVEEPEQNTPERLRALLVRWAEDSAHG